MVRRACSVDVAMYIVETTGQQNTCLSHNIYEYILTTCTASCPQRGMIISKGSCAYSAGPWDE